MERPTAWSSGRFSFRRFTTECRISCSCCTMGSIFQLEKLTTPAGVQDDSLSSSSCIWREQSATHIADVLYTSGHSADAVTQFVGKSLLRWNPFSTILRGTIRQLQQPCKCVTRDPTLRWWAATDTSVSRTNTLRFGTICSNRNLVQWRLLLVGGFYCSSANSFYRDPETFVLHNETNVCMAVLIQLNSSWTVYMQDVPLIISITVWPTFVS